jgi:hypothetical protein
MNEEMPVITLQVLRSYYLETLTGFSTVSPLRSYMSGLSSLISGLVSFRHQPPDIFSVHDAFSTPDQAMPMGLSPSVQPARGWST